MEAQSNLWLPLTEYALRSGMSISTLRRKIKSNTISYKMEEGRYLIRGDELAEGIRPTGFVSSDEPASRSLPESRPLAAEREVKAAPVIPQSPPSSTVVPSAIGLTTSLSGAEMENLRSEMRRMQEDNLLRWKALEARVAGIAKKLEFFSEQMAEAKMLVKIFEEKLDNRA